MPRIWPRRWASDEVTDEGGSWQEVLRTLRPGSRTVVYAPTGTEPVLELARRGFRLLVAHEDPSFSQRCREELRRAGLASQMMGAHELKPERALQLARGFYDLFLTFDLREPSEEIARPFLAPQGRFLRLK